MQRQAGAPWSPSVLVLAAAMHGRGTINILQLKNFNDMKALGYIGAFLGGAIAGTALGILLAPEKGSETRTKIGDAVDDFCKKHNIRVSRKEVEDLVDDIKEATDADNE